MPVFKCMSNFCYGYAFRPQQCVKMSFTQQWIPGREEKTSIWTVEGDRFSITTAVAHVSPERTDTLASSCLPSGVSTDAASQQPPSTPFREPMSMHQAETWNAAANPTWWLPPVQRSTDFRFQSSARNTEAQSHPSQTPSHFALGCTVEVDNHASSQTGSQPSAATCAAGGAPLPLILSSTHSTFPTEGDGWGTRRNEGSFTFSILVIYRPSPSPSAGSSGRPANQHEMQSAELRLCSMSAPRESQMLGI